MNALDNPFLETLGARLVAWDEGYARIELELSERHLNRRGSLQGGVIATLLDAACGYAGIYPGHPGGTRHAATLQLSIAYLEKCTRGTIVAEGLVERLGKNVYFSRGTLLLDATKTLATAQGVFKYTRS
jgi:uncharacterized protein (TIGR00369 family)